MTRMCDYDKAFTRWEMYEKTGKCLECEANPKCPMHIKMLKKSTWLRWSEGDAER